MIHQNLMILDEKIEDYVKSYNYLLGKENQEFKLDKGYKNKSVGIILVNEHNNNNQLNKIFNNFIEYQNDFIAKISEKYFKNINIEEIKVQDACENNVPKFCSSDEEFLEIIMNNVLIKIDKEKNDDNKFNFDFDLDEIEKDLFGKIKPGLKRFILGKIETMKYFGNITNEEIINDFENKFKQKNITKEQIENINAFFKKDEHKNMNINDFLLILQKVMIFILTNNCFNGETDLNLVINRMSEKELDKIQLELIKLFINFSSKKDDDDEEEEEEDEFDKNIGFSVSNLSKIYQEIEKLLNINN